MLGSARTASAREALARLLSAAALAASFAILTPARADAPVVVGEVSTSVGHEEVVPVMRTALAAQLSSVKVPSGKRFVVSASLTKFETKSTGNDATTSCVVSLALRDAAGNLKGTLTGNGAVIAKRGDAKATQQAIDAAVHGATRNLDAVIAQ